LILVGVAGLSLCLESATFVAGQASADAGRGIHMPWCSARQLSLSNVTGPHTIQLQGQSAYWFLELRNHSDSSCLTGSTLTLLSVRATNGVRIPVTFKADPGGFGGNPKTFVLKPDAQAYAEIQDPEPSVATKGCKGPVRLTFSLPHRGGRFSVTTPDRRGTYDIFGACPHQQLSLSPTYSSTAFDAFMQTMNTSPTRLPYRLGSAAAA